jgi:hypothetical protein
MVDVVIRPSRLQKNGQMYQALLGGKMIHESRDPEHGVCRVLFKGGIDSEVHFYREGQERPYMRGTCKVLAGIQVKETDRVSARFIKYQEPDFSGLRGLRNG